MSDGGPSRLRMWLMVKGGDAQSDVEHDSEHNSDQGNEQGSELDSDRAWLGLSVGVPVRIGWRVRRDGFGRWGCWG